MHGHVKQVRLRDYFITAFLFVLFFWAYSTIIPFSPPQSSVTIGGTTISVELARTPAEQERGLSGRETLPEGTGILFIFDYPDYLGFWMPDMHFAVDIVWIGTDWYIIDITHDVTPESYPDIFTPSLPAQYVFEVPAGSAERYGWKVGDEVHF